MPIRPEGRLRRFFVTHLYTVIIAQAYIPKEGAEVFTTLATPQKHYKSSSFKGLYYKKLVIINGY